MHLTVLDEQHIQLNTIGAGFEVSGEHFGPLQMLAASLALCTASVVHAYGETAQLSLDGFGIDVRWDYVEDPYRVGTFHMELQVPAHIAPSRHTALRRAADTCTVHNTLLHAPAITTTVAVVEPQTGDHTHVQHVHQA